MSYRHHCNRCRNAYSVAHRKKKFKSNPDTYESLKKYVNARHKSHKETVLSYYGQKCECCGETEPKFLTVDHIVPIGGREKRAAAGHVSIYSWLVKNGFPEGFRLLCSNCNFGRARNGGICPHQEGSQARAKARSRECGEVPEDHGSVAQEMVEPLAKAKAAIYGNWSDNPFWPMDVM